MKNQVYTGTPTSRRFSKCPSTLKAGDPVFIGGVPGVALDDYQDITEGTTFLLNGSFDLEVVAATVLSPLSGKAIAPGDPVYAEGGSTDANNVTYGFTLDAASGGTLFGYLDPSAAGIGSGDTDTQAVMIGVK